MIAHAASWLARLRATVMLGQHMATSHSSADSHLTVPVFRPCVKVIVEMCSAMGEGGFRTKAVVMRRRSKHGQYIHTAKNSHRKLRQFTEYYGATAVRNCGYEKRGKVAIIK